MLRALPLFLLLLLCATSASGQRLDTSVRQLIVGIAPGWNSMNGQIQCFERRSSNWVAAGAPIRVLFGKNGVAWGRGIMAAPGAAKPKIERDNRAPAGVFEIGKIYTYDSSLPSGANYPFRTVGPGDAWVDDVRNPDYNRHVVVDPRSPPAWFHKQRMRHGDFAYRWLIEIRHNADPPIPPFGSAIFFHIRRGPDRPSAGCTTMAQSDLLKLIRWLRTDQDPHYALLPKTEYLTRWRAWGLPDPGVTSLF
jgi:L,D-peptidoglycan transpeptidase YkuD (ErfK/YbiS/YcfS/YnhG family)